MKGDLNIEYLKLNLKIKQNETNNLQHFNPFSCWVIKVFPFWDLGDTCYVRNLWDVQIFENELRHCIPRPERFDPFWAFGETWRHRWNKFSKFLKILHAKINLDVNF